MDSPDRWRHKFWPARSVESFVVSFPKAGRTWLRVMLAVAEAHLRVAALLPVELGYREPGVPPEGSVLAPRAG